MFHPNIILLVLLTAIKVCLVQVSNYNPYSLYLQTSMVAETTVQTNKNCFCVPYWQCKEDFVGLVDDGADIMDIRVYEEETQEDESEECTGDFDVCCQVQCGKLGSISNSSLIGDTLAYRIVSDGANPSNAANFGEFPWMLGLLQNRAYKCGASLIHPKVAITAAHCVAQGGVFKVRAGEFDWANQQEPLPHQDRLTQKIIIHPHYHPPSLSNDIALLILNQEFKLTENIGVVCLPPQAPKGSQPTIDKACIASGWGKNSYQNGAYQTTLKKVELPVVPQQQCLHSLRTARLGPHFQLHPSFMCAGGKHNKDTCKGDGGSPLVCPVDDSNEHFEQVGIVSWGLTCGLRNTPGVYVNVAMFIDWIDKQLISLNLDTFIYKL